MANFLDKLFDRFTVEEFPEESEEITYDAPSPVYSEGKSLNFHPRTERSSRVESYAHKELRSAPGQQVIIVKARSTETAEEVVSHLRMGRMVVCNLESVDMAVSQRIIDYVSGAAFAIDGSVHPVSDYIFVIVPSSVGMLGEEHFEAQALEQLLQQR